ncbi:MAG TPA: MFS transporter [Urbifossiella sp.]|nr:MFS transporter [Urbifossiella sp.]
MSLNGHAPATGAPTRVRYAVLALLCVLAMITYMDRAANGSARGAIIADLNASGRYETPLTDADFFWVLIAFQLCYAIFEVPSGWLGDTAGPRSTLLRVVLWWSVFVFLTGFAGMSVFGVFIGFTGLIVIQALFGVGEAGAFPNIAKALYNWFPAGDRGFAKSIIWMSARFMGGLTPVVWILLTHKELGGMGWRETMWLFAALAVVWCVVFALWFRNKPAENPAVNAAELAAIDAGRVTTRGPVVVPWGKLIRSRNLWAVCLMYVITNFCWYFLMYNLPGTLKTEFKGWTTTVGGELLVALLAGCPLLIGMFGCLLGGTLSDRYIRRTGDRKWGRRLFGMIGYGGAGLFYLAAAGVKVAEPDNLWLFAGCLIMMGFMNDLIMAPAWAVCQDIGRDYAATVSGAMNMFGNLVGAVSGILVTGYIIKHYEAAPTTGILTCLVMYAVVYFLGVGIWLFIDPTKPVAEEQG